MTELLPFIIVLFAGIFFSEVFARLHVPWVVALVLGGVVLGFTPTGVIFENDILINFFADIGLVFLMFMAGLETRFDQFRHISSSTIRLTLLNGLIPFGVGIGIGFLFGFDFATALLIGVIFISSSIAVVVPAMHESHLFKTKVGKAIVQSTIINDIASLVILSFIIQSTNPITNLPVGLYIVILILVIWCLKWAVPNVVRFFRRVESEGEEKDADLRLVFVILLGSVLLFEALGMHPIIGGFFTGLVMSEARIGDMLRTQINTLAYSLFIPIFFVLVGVSLDFSVFSQAQYALPLVLVVVFGASVAKYVSGYWAGRSVGFSKLYSKIVGSATVPQLSTTLAVVFTGVSLGLISTPLETALVILSITSTLIAPFLISRFTNKSRAV
jgi:Kef-type K+ transport system membrane component KefB